MIRCKDCVNYDGVCTCAESPNCANVVDDKGIKHSYTYRELEQMESKGRVEEVKE